MPRRRKSRARSLRSWLLVAALALVSHRGRAQVGPTSTLSFASAADTYVDSGSSGTNFNSANRLRAGSSPTRVTYLRFVVSGVAGRHVQSARLRLGVVAGAPSGGNVHLISDHAWNEAKVTWKTRPAIDGPVVATLGAVTTGATAEFVLDGAITADGTIDVALESTNGTPVGYGSSLATSGPKPTLVLTVADTPPAVTIVQPPTGAGFYVGDAITLQATATDDTGADLASRIAWSSDVAGALGTGGVVTTSLAAGTHVVTASATDARGLTAAAHVTLDVTPQPPGNTPPLVAITAPTATATLVSGAPVRFRGSASDLEDGDLSARIAWTSDRDGALGTGATFTRALSSGTHVVTARVSDAGGLGAATSVTVDVAPGLALEFPAVADASVDAGFPGVNFGTSPLLAVDANTVRTSYLRFDVHGVGTAPVVAAVLRLHVDATAAAESDAGGVVYALPGASWDESTVTFADRPAIDGAPLATIGAVRRDDTVEPEVTAALAGDGTYDFAVVGVSADECDYRSREGGPAPTLVVWIAGEPPAVSITTPADGAVLFAPGPVTLAGVATDARDGDLGSAIQWTSSRDGALGSGATLTRALSVGSHVLTATATDAGGLSGEARIAVRVRTPNAPPVVTITAPPDGATLTRGTLVPLAATATDDFDGDLTARIRWTSSRDGALAGPAAALSTGTHVLTASVTDSDGATGSAGVHVTVVPSPPAVTVGAPADGTVVFAGTSVAFAGTASDAADGDLTAALRWLSDRDGLVGTGGGFTTSRLSVGTHAITATVRNAAGLSTSVTRTVVVRAPNVAPVVTIVAPTAGASLVTGRPVLLAATALDSDDGDLAATVRWTSSRDGVLGTGGTVIVASLSLGTHVLGAAVTDHDGATTTASVTVTVLPTTMTVPATADTYLDASSPTKSFGTATSLWADASPVKIALLRFGVTGVGTASVRQAIVRLTAASSSAAPSASGGVLRAIAAGSWSEATTTYATRPAVDGPALATQGKVAAKQVVPFDVSGAVRGDGVWDFALVSASSDEVVYQSREASTGAPELVLTLSHDQAPVVAIAAPAGGARFKPGVPVTFRGRATDGLGGDLGAQLAWSSNLDGPLGTGATLTVGTLRSGHHTITARVTNAAGLSAQAQVAIEILTPPLVQVTSPADGAVVLTTDLPLRLAGTAHDLVDGELGSRLDWRSSRDGALASGAAITAALSVGTHQLTASVTDDAGLTGAATITVRVRTPNAPPVVAIGAPADGTSIPAGTPIALAATALDDFDGDLGAAIRWTSSRDGAVAAGPAATVRLSEGVHTLVARAIDSDGAAGAASVTVSVTPTAPVVTIATPADGAQTFVGTPVALAATAVDATDGDLSARLRWTSDRDGLVGTGGSVNAATLSVGTHVVTASVADAGGLVGTASRTLVVRPPNQPPVIAIRAPSAGATLLSARAVLLGASATDVEDGDLAAAVRWTSSRDGALGTGGTLVVPGLTAGAHTLTATVTDRDGATRTATVAVTVVPSTLTFNPTADTYVDGGSTSSKFGTATSVLAGASPTRIALFRFPVSGIGAFSVQRATLTLTVGSGSSDGSASGGSVHAIANNTWTESGTTYKNRPAVDGAILATAAKVIPKQTVDFDVTSAVRADGIVNFAVDSTSTDSVRYASREASAGKPRLTLSLGQDTAPLVTIVAPASGSRVDAGATVRLAATATDAEGGDLGAAIAWRSDRDGALGTGPALSVATLHPGWHVISADVVDAGGHPAHAETRLAVATPPVVTLAAPADGTGVVPGAPVALAATANDVLDGNLTSAIAWTSSLDGFLGAGGALSVTSLRSGTHTIRATVTDAAGKSSSASATVVVDAPPAIRIDAPADGATASPGDTVSLAATARDLEDGDLGAAVRWTSSLDGALGSGAALDVRTLRSGSHTVTASVTDAGGKQASASIAIVVNAAPTVAITAPGDGTVASPGDVVHLVASAHDLEDGDLAGVDWSSSLDGPLGRGTTLDVATLRSGAHTITATVADSGGKTASGSVRVLVDAAPTLAIGAPADGAVVSPGDVVHLAAAAHDLEDGDLTAVAWTSSLDGALGAGTALDVPLARSGTHVLTATVVDAGGKETSASVRVVVDAPPVVAIAAPADGTVVSPGDVVHLVATASDREDGPLTAVRWSSDLDGPLGTGATLDTTALRSGTHVVTAAVADAAGRSATAAVMLVVNAAPAIAIAAPAEGAVYAPGESIRLAATAHDLEDGDAVAVAWTSDLAGALGTGPTLDVATLPSGTHAITAVATDSGGKQASATVHVVVDAPPAVAIVAPAPGALFAPGDTIRLQATATDPEQGDVGAAVVWTSSLAGPLGTGAALDARLASGTHVLVATVADAAGRSASASVTVTVDAAPTIAVVAPASGAVYAPGDTVVLQASASDLEQGDLGDAVTWTSSLDGPLGTGRTLPVGTLRSGTHAITARVADRSGKAAVATVSVVVDAAPALAIATPAAGAVFAPGDPVLLSASASDLEDGDLGATVAWASDLDGPLGTGATLSVSTLRPGTHVVTATVGDTAGKRASATTSLLVNAAPSVAITGPAAGTIASPGDAVALRATASDPEDGDLGAAIVWSSDLDGLLGTGAALDPTTLRAGHHRITASVTDRYGAGASATVLVVVDAAPSLAIAAPAANAVFAPDETVALAAAALDAEEGDLGARVGWTSSVDGPLGTGTGLAAGPLSSGTHVLTATVADADGRGATASVTITVAPRITLSGTRSTGYTNASMAPKTLVDALAGVFLASPSNLYPLTLGGADGLRIRGGRVLGQYDRSLSWDQMHSMNNAGVVFDGNRFTVDGFRVDDVTDALRPRFADDFTIRNVWASYVRDDCIENDHVHGGLVDDSLFDGCYAAFSARPSAAIADSGFDGSGKTWTIQNTLVRLQAMPGPRGGSADNLGLGVFFKWDSWNTPSASLSPKLALRNNVFMAERVGQSGGDRMGIPPGQLLDCSNNVMVWLGTGPFPATLPSCFTVTTDRGVWDAAVAAWKARHPDLAP